MQQHGKNNFPRVTDGVVRISHSKETTIMFPTILVTLLRLDEYFQNIVILNNAVIKDGRVEAESKKNIMLLCEVTQNTQLSTEFTKSTKNTYS